MTPRTFMRPGVFRKPSAFMNSRRPPLGARRGPGAWTPLTLRWRTRRVKAARSFARTSVSTATVLRPQLHLHFGIRVGVAEHQRSLGLAQAAGAPASKGLLIERRETIRHATSIVTRAFEARSRLGARLTPHVWRTPIGPVGALRREAHRVGVRDIARPPLIARLAGRQALPSGNDVAPAGRRRVSARSWNSASDITDTPSSLFRRTLVHRSARAPIHRGETESEAMREGASTRRRQQRPAEIVWRESARPSAIGSAPAGRSAAMPMAPVRHAPDATDAHEAPPVEASRPRPATVRFADFEPGLVDRLTDDVIRRVERRVRIERERRGL